MILTTLLIIAILYILVAVVLFCMLTSGTCWSEEKQKVVRVKEVRGEYRRSIVASICWPELIFFIIREHSPEFDSYTE